MTRTVHNILVCTAACAASTGMSSAQDFAIDWLTIDGGGSTSTGGAYAVSGSIGQPDAGRLTGGNYTLVGGFWSVIQEDGLPLLKIELRGGNLVLSWPASAAGTVVQAATQLLPGGAGWSNVPGDPTRVGDRFELVVGPALTPPNPIRFFRLRSP